ncbi:GTP-binding protein [Mesobacillus maritimus]|uniref:GTP-binding protein n=1 Tax=Mesobacillus maritimus TaxID=1643336 RepID=UPI00203B682D|nr:GTP-binding protein [Mesobacillus maritimus]MCM3585659.1 GTP-binding protein [Mesobacillus maritimus]
MTIENQFINKTYFEEIIETPTEDPIQVLSELYLEENKKEISDFSYIRFAQGEVYFHYKDYETAIFKWENIHNELGPWAKKNMADAYLELGLPETAESLYQSIEGASPTLQIESGLRLLSIYREKGWIEQATAIVHSIVTINPDYPRLTETAWEFFEEQADRDNAIKLASEEAVRTGSLIWFNRIEDYIGKGYTAEKEPSYFNSVLTSLFSINRRRFEQLVGTLWNSYKGKETYLQWMQNFNSVFLDLEVSRNESWNELSKWYQEAYLELMNGSRLIKELSQLIPNHLTNWVKITDSSTSLMASAAVMAWSERFPSTIPTEVIREAEELILNAENHPTAQEDSLELLQMVEKWAKENGIEPGQINQWKINELLDQNQYHLLLAGRLEEGKAEFINQLFNETLLTGPTSSIVAFKYGEEPVIQEVTDSGTGEINDKEQFQAAIGVRRQNHKKEVVIDFALPNGFLKNNQVKLVGLPGMNEQNVNQHALYQYVHFADGLLFFLDEESSLTDKEKEILKQVNITAPNLPIHFVIPKSGLLTTEEETRLIEKTLNRIQVYYPKAKLFIHSTNGNSSALNREFSEFLNSFYEKDRVANQRITQIQHYVRKSIDYLLDKRIEMETELIDSIRWNEEMVSKLTGAIHQIEDLEDEKKKSIKNSYVSLKEELKSDMLLEIPKILRGCAELIKEDSDFSKLHLVLNDEMNRKVQDYLETVMLKKFHVSLQEWIQSARSEFDQSQYMLDEMCAGFNGMYGEERLQQECDFKILDDWKRDANRMTSGIQLERMNFLLRFTPAQFLLKSAGKLLSVLPQNNTMIFTKYKAHIENEDYQEFAHKIARKFFQQFELFEQAIERDINLFYKEPLEVLNSAVEEALQLIETNKAELESMRVKPELYRDPLNLFEVQLRQYEWMAAAGKQI